MNTNYNGRHIKHIPSHTSDDEAISVLFFGRSECDASEKILKHLHRCGFDITYVKSKQRGEDLPEDIGWWSGDYILCFRSLFMLPKFLLDKATVAAINFHPAPPEYPGSGCINFALYDESDSYGVTAHIMNEKIDNGRILEVRKFPVHKNETLSSLLDRTHSELTNLCLDFVTGISNFGKMFIENKLNAAKHLSWKGDARKMIEVEKLQLINANISARELERVIRATYIEGYPPKINLHGYEFVLTSNKKKTAN